MKTKCILGRQRPSVILHHAHLGDCGICFCVSQTRHGHAHTMEYPETGQKLGGRYWEGKVATLEAAREWIQS